MIKITAKFEGFGELQAQLKREEAKYLKGTKRATKMEANKIMDDSVQEVPKDTHNLADSAFVEQDSNGNVTFGYGAPGHVNGKNQMDSTEYMVAVHERLDVHHPNGKAKFLEDPVNRHVESLEASLISRVRNFLGL